MSPWRERSRASTALALAALLLAGCRSPRHHRERADRAAAAIIAEKQQETFGRTEAFTVERPSDTFRRRLLLGQGLPAAGPDSLGTDQLEPIGRWPEKDYPPRGAPAAETVPPWTGPEPYALSLHEALQIGARNSRDYQAQKEAVFSAALALEFQRDRFRNTLFGMLDGLGQLDRTSATAPDGVVGSASLEATKLLRNGILLAGSIGIDLVKLLTGDRSSSLGLLGDASISIPLLRGAGRHVVTEPLTQAERDVAYQLRTFERFKKIFAVSVASGYLEVLRELDRAANAEENYRGLVVLTRRTRALDGAGRLPGIQVDQARQDELRARDRWIASLQSYQARLDAYKTTLGLPPDARLALRREELERMSASVTELFGEGESEEGGGEVPAADAPVLLPAPGQGRKGPLELEERTAVLLAFQRREDLATARGRVVDAQRQVAVAADALRAGLTLTGSATVGGSRSLSSAGLAAADLNPGRGLYTADLLLDLPLERTAEGHAYRESYLALEAAVRSLQAVEDQIKSEIRASLRALLQAREGVLIQARAVGLARGRVASTTLFLEAGRAQVRDVLEAQEALVSAQNALTEALVSYRVTELELQRDVGVLEVGAEGLWKEYRPDA
ncbi:MAG: TolC family protein [Planctomycetaceae bacterium]